jgi:anti-sigma regulatory factor (Ser/Thr protein kinase)
VSEDLHLVRRRVASRRATASLSSRRREDFVVAVNEVATNAIEYDDPPRQLRLWRSEDSVVGEVVGRGHIADPLVGRHRPAPDAEHGRGLWIVNQVCDLVELRSGGSTTTLRVHVRC